MRSLSNHALEIAIGLVALMLSTVSLLVSAYALTIVALVCGAVNFGILLGKQSADVAPAALEGPGTERPDAPAEQPAGPSAPAPSRYP